MPVEAKLFFEVFPELNMDKELSSLFEDTMIEKVVTGGAAFAGYIVTPSAALRPGPSLPRGTTG